MTDDGALETVPVAPGDAPRCDLGGITACLKALERERGSRKRRSSDQLSLLNLRVVGLCGELGNFGKVCEYFLQGPELENERRGRSVRGAAR